LRMWSCASTAPARVEHTKSNSLKGTASPSGLRCSFDEGQ
jgi:hypothetical protein